MSLKFQDIMKNFYNDETLGIKNEDAPVNATGAAVAGTGDDAGRVVGTLSFLTTHFFSPCQKYLPAHSVVR